MVPRVSVVVPTYKRPDYIERCLKALLTQDLPPEEFEVLIVDDAVDDTTRQRVAEVMKQAEHEGRSGYTVRYVQGRGEGDPDHSPASARNIGWQAAQSEIIAFTDDDCIPEQRWLRTGLAAFGDDIAAISGRIVTPLPARPTDYEYNAAQITRAEFATANSFYRRSVLEKVGGFDERFRAAWREDSDLYFTLLAHHEKCIFLHDAAVMHPVRPERWGISIKQQRKSMYNALLYKKHPVLYRQRIQQTIPWRYYCIVGALFITILAMLAQVWLLAVLAFCAWLVMTLLFCLERLYKTKHTLDHICEMLITSAIIPPLAIFWRLYGALKFRVLFL
jgi:glycosyltransferase involved in cell wall biosynthesis